MRKSFLYLPCLVGGPLSGFRVRSTPSFHVPVLIVVSLVFDLPGSPPSLRGLRFPTLPLLPSYPQKTHLFLPLRLPKIPFLLMCLSRLRPPRTTWDPCSSRSCRSSYLYPSPSPTPTSPYNSVSTPSLKKRFDLKPKKTLGLCDFL